MEASDLEQNHWKSANSTPLPSGNLLARRSSSSRPNHDASSPRDASPERPPSTHSLHSDMDEAKDGYRRRKKSPVGIDRLENRTLNEGMSNKSRRKSQAADEGEHKHHILAQNEYEAEAKSSRSSSGDFELDDTLSEDALTDDEETGLTKPDRRKRRRRKRRNTLLDERIAGDSNIEKQERKLADLSVLKSSAINALLIGLWYVVHDFSLTIY